MEIELIIAVVILVATFFLATIDMAFSRLSDVSLRRLAADVGEEEGNEASGELLRGMLENRPRFRFALSASIQILLVVYAILLTLILLRFVPQPSTLLPVALATGLVSTVIFRQILPRLIVTSNPDKKLLFLLPLVQPLYSITTSLASVLDPRLSAKDKMKIEATISPDANDERSEDASDDFQALMEVGEAEGIIEGKDREMIETLVEFGDTRVGEIMTPRTEICSIPIGSTIKDARDLIVREKYSRLPVYGDNVDNILGMVYVRDILQAWAEGKENNSVRKILRDALFIPETKTAAELLKDMQRTHVQAAIVIDEYGGVAGLITVEDILEEIVGEIEDEDTGPEEIIEIVEGTDGYWDVLGSTEIDKIERLFDADLEDDDYTTIAGFVISELGYVPKVGEVINLPAMSVEVLRADEKKLHLLRLRKPENPIDRDSTDEN